MELLNITKTFPFMNWGQKWDVNANQAKLLAVSILGWYEPLVQALSVGGERISVM